MSLRVAGWLIVIVAFGCAGPSRKARHVEAVVDAVTRDAELLLAAGQPAAALRLARAVDRVDPERGLVRRLRERGATSPAPTPLLGDVASGREPLERPTWERVALWLPDRLLDIADLVSFDLAFGPGLWLDVHLTHFAQLAGGAKETSGLGWHEERSLGLQKSQHRGLAVFGFGEQLRYQHLFGTNSGLVASGRHAGAHEPGDPYYRELRDYWELGASAQLLIVGLEADLHPVEFWDLLAGLAGFDPGADDLASTRAWEPGQQMRLRLEALHEIAIDPRSLADYAAYKARREVEAAASDPAAP